MNYRADIDGLRAVAILLVLIFHAGLTFFPSGFVGVDVFFVISGFLITSIIYNSLNKATFSFIDFYNRRLWRLQPVLICFLFVILGLTLLFFLPDDLIQFGRSARKTALFISNVFFNRLTSGYFSPDSHQLPLLHTWSLSIEWQCYLLLPLAMYGLQRLLSRKMLIFAVYALTLIFLSLTLYYSKTIPAETYYQLSSRIFEFLIGSSVALLPLNHLTIPRYVANLLGGLALASIVYIATLNHILLGYPNVYAIVVCIATGLLIILGRFHPNTLIIKLLSLKPIVFIGVLSYSLYIWHWAVFSLLRYQTVQETGPVLAACFVLIFILAYISWRYIEKPARRFRQLKFRYTFVSLVLLPIVMIHAADYFIKENSGFPQRFNQELVTIYQQLDKFNSTQRPLCISNKDTNEAQCRVGAKNSQNKTAFMMGDSFSNHYWGFMDVLGQANNVSVFIRGTSSCLTLPDIQLYDWWHFKKQIYQECTEQTKHYYEMVEKNHYDNVIIGQVWSNYLSDSIINKLGDKRSPELTKERIEHSLDKAIKIITTSGARPILIKNTALMKENNHDCFFRHIKLRQTYDPKQCNFDLHLSAGEQWFNDLFAKMQMKYPQLIIIDPKQVQCPENKCSASLNGVPVYRDVGHITDYASYQLGSMYLKKYGNPLS